MKNASQDQISIAVIGLGLIGRRHAQTILEEPGARLIAVVDPVAVPKIFLSHFKVPCYPNISDLIAGPDKPQCAVICTPNDTHVPVGLELIKAGIHILVEKPVSTDIESGQQLVQAAEEAQVKLLVGHHRRFNPHIIRAKQVIESRTLGNIIAINGLWTAFKPLRYFQAPTEWRQSSSGGVLLINMIHDIDLLQHLFGPITRVYAERTTSQRRYLAEEGAAITLRFACGVVGTFVICDHTPSPHSFEAGTGENPLISKTGEDFYRVFGTEGTLEIPDCSIWSFAEGEERSWSSKLVVEEGGVEEGVPFVSQLKHFLRVGKGEEEPMCSGADGVRALIVCEAIKRSMRDEVPVTIDVST
ncbi:hypothetical protein LTR64_002207 [Lithohypha guttulata]|uniref:uncharacterized protein n=1 Tax=Lithohypha guttulata TaxID=1690604 RepID=UPI002DE175A4|nr:hypothetical protein LTR51_001567 [Lithohypha guttulata]